MDRSKQTRLLAVLTEAIAARAKSVASDRAIIVTVISWEADCMLVEKGRIEIWQT